METLKIGGVPEHFNLPWHLCIENKAFEAKNINLEWTDYPGGTGVMCKALRNREIDVAIILTEGLVKDVIEGNPSKIVQTYIDTPLIWGIHVAANSKHNSINDINDTKIAISRYGSGSHLMAYVNAEKQGWPTDNLKFEVIKNLDGAVESLTEGTSDYFMWEHFTTKPLVDNGTFRRVGDCPTPWPCFVIAVREEVLENKPELIQQMLKVVNTETENFKQKENIAELLAERYGQKLEDITKWLSITEWSQKQMEINTLDKVQEQLFNLDIINTKVDSKTLISQL